MFCAVPLPSHDHDLLEPKNEATGNDRDLPEIGQGVYDPQWQPCNWRLTGLRGFPFAASRRMSSRMIESRIGKIGSLMAPGRLSLCYPTSRQGRRVEAGHLVVCVGFTDEGT